MRLTPLQVHVANHLWVDDAAMETEAGGRGAELAGAWTGGLAQSL